VNLAGRVGSGVRNQVVRAGERTLVLEKANQRVTNGLAAAAYDSPCNTVTGRPTAPPVGSGPDPYNALTVSAGLTQVMSP